MVAKQKNSRALRFGYTTGACAAAAAKAAALALLKQETVNSVQISLPDGKPVVFEVIQCVFDRSQGACSIIKDAGDDPDVTHGAEIRATVRRIEEPGIQIKGGAGVGMVTKPGLEIAVGLPAINPVPRQMITQSVTEAMSGAPDNRGLEVTISVPKGEELAKQTLNSRLGIIGGISILGTTGIVIPYSASAYTASISQALAVAAATGCHEAVLTTGRRSEKFAQQELKLPEECYIQSGDFIGYSLKECVRRGLAKATIWSMVGKMSKLADGHFYTNVSDSTVNMRLLARLASESGIPEEAIKSLGEAVTANHFRKMLSPEHIESFFASLCKLAAKKCKEYVGGKIEIVCIVADPEGTILGRANA